MWIWVWCMHSVYTLRNLQTHPLARGEHQVFYSIPLLVLLKKSLSLNLELGWLPTSLRNPPVSNPRSTGVTSMHAVEPSSLHGGRGFELWRSCSAISPAPDFSQVVFGAVTLRHSSKLGYPAGRQASMQTTNLEAIFSEGVLTSAETRRL